MIRLLLVAIFMILPREQVSIRYTDASEDCLKNISFTVNPGETIAFIGATGSGKATLINLLMRFFETTGGDIKIDGVSIKELRRENVRSMFDMVLQKTWLFEGTVRENLVYNCENISDEATSSVDR